MPPAQVIKASWAIACGIRSRVKADLLVMYLLIKMGNDASNPRLIIGRAIYIREKITAVSP